MGRHSARRPRRTGGNGLAAIAAQGSQAAGSLLLQVVAARTLGITGLGQFGLLYGILVLATAISSGFVGDSLTVLDRGSSDVRAALQNWLVIVALVGALLCSMGVWVTGFVTKQDAVAFGVATFVFLIEDAIRRLLMASLRFWRIVVVDTMSLLVLAVVLLFAPALTLAWLFVALAAGQAVAIVVGVCLLPTEERWLARPALPAQHRIVFAYGALRALQQAVRPSLLALTRVVVIALVGVAAAGQLEAGRIYTAPALLVVFGLNSFLFASYALDSKSALTAALRRADRGVLLLVAITVAFGVVAVLCVPVLGPLIAGEPVRHSGGHCGGLGCLHDQRRCRHTLRSARGRPWTAGSRPRRSDRRFSGVTCSGSNGGVRNWQRGVGSVRLGARIVRRRPR